MNYLTNLWLIIFKIYFNLMAFLLELFIFASGACGLIWAYYNYSKLKEINLGGAGEEEFKQPLHSRTPTVVEIGEIIREGAS